MVDFTAHPDPAAGAGTESDPFCRATRERDWELATGMQAGEEAAYEALIQEYQTPVYNLVYRLLRDPANAPDVVQEIFLKIFRNIEQFRGQSTLKTWIYRIAVNEAYNYQRWFFRHRRQEVTLEEDAREGLGWLAILTDPSQSPYDYVLDRETQRRVSAALQRVKDPYRTAVVLRDMEGLSYEEIATILNVNVGTVKSRIMRGREFLRKELMGAAESWKSRELAPQSLERAV